MTVLRYCEVVGSVRVSTPVLKTNPLCLSPGSRYHTSQIQVRRKKLSNKVGSEYIDQHNLGKVAAGRFLDKGGVLEVRVCVPIQVANPILSFSIPARIKNGHRAD